MSPSHRSYPGESPERSLQTRISHYKQTRDLSCGHIRTWCSNLIEEAERELRALNPPDSRDESHVKPTPEM